jgi:hypothetical protein
MTISQNWVVGAAMKWEVFAVERKHKVHEAKINIKQIQTRLMTRKRNYN